MDYQQVEDLRDIYGSQEWANSLLRYCIRFINGSEFRTYPKNGIIYLKNNQHLLENHGFKYQAKILGFWISKYIKANQESFYAAPQSCATPNRGEEASLS